MCLEPTILNSLSARFDGAGAIGRAPAGIVKRPAFNGRHRYNGRTDKAGTHWPYEHVTRSDHAARAKMAGVAEYCRYDRTARNTKPTNLTTVTRRAGWTSQARGIGQCILLWTSIQVLRSVMRAMRISSWVNLTVSGQPSERQLINCWIRAPPLGGGDHMT